MKIEGIDMIGFFKNATKNPIMDESEGLKYPYNAEDIKFDKIKRCYLVNGGEVYIHTCPSDEHNNRPNCCEYCMYNSTGRFYKTIFNGKKTLIMTCKGLYMCHAFHRLNKNLLKGKSLFFRDSEHFKTHEQDIPVRIGN